MLNWNQDAAPSFAKVENGALVRLSTMLPEFDESTRDLRALALADRVAAGWYEVADCPAPNTAESPFGPTPVPTAYTLGPVNTGAGTVSLLKAA